jgi:hypothetical protein
LTPGLERGEHPAVTLSFLYRAFWCALQFIRRIWRSDTDLLRLPFSPPTAPASSPPRPSTSVNDRPLIPMRPLPPSATSTPPGYERPVVWVASSTSTDGRLSWADGVLGTRRLGLVGLVGVDEALEEVGEQVELVRRERPDSWWRSEENGLGGGDGCSTGGREGDELAATVARVRPTFDEAVRFELVDHERRIRSVEAVCVSDLAESLGPAAQLEQDLASPAPEAEPESLLHVAVAAVGIDEAPHEGPSPLRHACRDLAGRACLVAVGRRYHGTVWPR